MKEVVLQRELAENKMLKKIVEAATPILDEAIGKPAPRVIATWSLKSDNGERQLLQLQLSDIRGQAETEFALEELQPPEHARRRFYRLWGDLLEAALGRQVQALEAALVDDEGS